MPTITDLDRKSIRQALRAWDSTPRLGQSPLTKLACVNARRKTKQYADSPLGYGAALREVLQSALQHLKPEGEADPLDKRWRPYLILTSQYLEGRSPDYVVEQLSIARSTYDHEQAEALERMADIVLEWEGGEAQPATPRPVNRVPLMAPPKSPPALVGRGAVFTAIKNKLTAGATLALTGLPGVGKTALAIDLAHNAEIQARFPDGVLWASLGRAPDALTILGMWGVALGLALDELAKLTRPAERAQIIHAAIGQRQMLLVLDDVWNTADASVLRLGGPHCACLLTSRLPGVGVEFAGEQALTIPELNEIDGLSLLAAFVPEALDEAAQLTLVRAVGGLPLALTLIGRYIQREAHLGQPRRAQAALKQLLERTGRLSLRQTPSLLQAAAPVSLREVIALSDRELDADARQALRALAVFPSKPNTFSEEAALAVTATTVETLDTLSDYGLLESAAAGRYTLHQTIAEYALDEALESARFRLAQFFVDWVANTRDQAAFNRERENVLCALEIAHALNLTVTLIQGAIALYPFLEAAGLHAQAEPHLLRAETAAREADDALGLMRVLGHLGKSARVRGEYARAESLFNESLALARELDERDQVEVLLQGLGVVAFSRGDYALAEQLYQEALTSARAHHHSERLSSLLSNYGSLLLTRGELQSAQTCFDEGLALAHQTSDQNLISALRVNLGVLAARRGDLTQAESHFRAGLEVARALNARYTLSFLLTNLGTLANDRQDYPNAEAYFQEGLRLAREMGDRARQSHLLANLGALATRRRDMAQAESYLQEALDTARAIGHREHQVLALTNLGLWAKTQADARAQTFFTDALALAREIGHQRYINVIEKEIVA